MAATLALAALLGCDTQHSDYRYAMHLVLSGNAATGARMLHTLASIGHAPAQLRLGLLYQQGHGVPQDPRRAAHWFERAARQDDVGGQYLLAAAYQRGEGVPVSPEKAFEWFHRLAERGYAPAQFQVSRAYGKGEGVERDERLAVQWLERAANGEHHEAAKRLALAYRQGLMGLPEDPRQAEAWEHKTQLPRF
ncbi:MAG: sel1 repeat family protein [Chromatiaceae bacterium]|nr:sel1 repeat family protein [Chromatiaceae bacterium]